MATSPSSETTGHFWAITRSFRQSRAIIPLVNPKVIRFQVTVAQIYELTWSSQLQSWVSPLNGNWVFSAAWSSLFNSGLAKCVLREEVHDMPSISFYFYSSSSFSSSSSSSFYSFYSYIPPHLHPHHSCSCQCAKSLPKKMYKYVNE